MRQQDLRLFEHFLTRLRGSVAVLAVVSVSALATACGGGGGDDDGDEGDGGSNVDVNFAGNWSVTQTVQDTCGAGNYTETYTLTIEGQGAEMTLDDGSELVELEVNGNTASWSAEYSEDGYTTSMEGHATVSGDTISGVSDWSVSGPDISCGGTSTFQGTRVAGGNDDGSDDNDDGSDDNDGGSADDEEMEPNDSWENATLISLSGTSVTYAGNVDDTNDESDYFVFTPGTSGSYTITLNGLDEMDDIDLAVRDSNGNVLDSSEEVGPDEAVTIALSAGLVYYIEVYGYETLTGADYELTVARN